MTKELLFSVSKKDLVITYFSGTGAGGQHRNRHMNSVRMTHPESGATSTGQSNREMQANLKEAFQTLINSAKFKIWHNQKVHEILTGKTIEQQIKEDLTPDKLKIECKDDEGRWVNYIES
jgi:protein subunit release factor A